MKFCLVYSALLIAAGFVGGSGIGTLLTVLVYWLLLGVYCAGKSDGRRKA